MEYRTELGISSKYKFGVELEFTGIYLDHLAKIFGDRGLPVRYVLNHKNTYASYKEWYLDIDETVTLKQPDGYYNGELSSRIMIDRREFWEELKVICQILKENGVSVDSRCSNHVTVALYYLKDEKYFFEVLSKLLVLFENEIALFYMGDQYEIRKTMSRYARRLGLSFLDKMDLLDFGNMNLIAKFSELYPTTYGKHCAINLRKYFRDNLMEIRYPNGSVDCCTIQNNVNFSLKLIDAIDRRVFDLDKLSKLIDDNVDSIMERLMSGESSLDYFTWLVDTISISQLDKDGFMEQYDKVVKSKRK